MPIGGNMATDAALADMIRELHDKQAIREVISNYSRGLDRKDRDLLQSCYHPDALDDHGMYVGGPGDFFEWADLSHLRYFRTHQHVLTNHTCSLEGDVAHTETYWMFAGMAEGEDKLAMFGGRYVDRLEKRNGQWRIAARKCVLEWWGTPSDGLVTPEWKDGFAKGGKLAKDRSDCSYERPLTVDPRRVGLRLGI
jgi:ketosteroid isomerase-like protein